MRFQAIDDVPTFLDELHTRMSHILKRVFEAPLETLSGDDLRARLLAVDPEAATRIHRNDRKRTIRATAF